MLKRHGALSVGAHWRGRESTNAPATPKPILRFDPRHFLAKAGGGRAVIQCRRQDVVFSQGEAADAVFYIQRGKIKLTVVSAHGKEAIIAVFEAGDFFGEGCLAGQPLRMASAMAITDASLLKISKEQMRRTLHAGALVLGPVHVLRALAQHPGRGRSGGSPVQHRREAAGSAFSCCWRTTARIRSVMS